MSSETHKNLTTEEQLKAWNFWKEICCFGSCLPQGEAMQELIQQGKLSEDESEKYYKYFCRQITTFFKKATKKKCYIIANDIFKEREKHNNECLIEFDVLFSEYTGKQNEGKRSTAKAWKDDLWLKANNSSNAEIETIVGNIKALTLTLITNYLFKTYGRENFTREKGKSYFNYNSPKSMDAPVSEDGSNISFGKKFADTEFIESVDVEADEHAAKEILKSLTLQEKLLLLSVCAGLDFNREETQNLLGLKKSRTFELWKNIRKRMITSKIDREPATFHFLKNRLIREMSSEKSAEPFLNMWRTSEKGE